jgi:peptide/nickel transport system ATP-binding protein
MMSMTDSSTTHSTDDTRDVLVIDDLRLTADGVDGPVELVHGVHLTVREGEQVALVGESGSGKSVTARSVLRLDGDLEVQGRVIVDGADILALPEKAMGAVRGRKVGMVFQDPLSALDPYRRIEQHLVPLFRARGLSRSEAREEAVALLTELQIPDPESKMRFYPHEFSGGMMQRIVIAIALAGDPDLIIADEPTTALDVRVQKQVLRILSAAAARRGLAVLLITHDVGIVAGFAERVVVMFRGRIVETAPVREFFRGAVHPYSRGLLNAVPRLDSDDRLVPLDRDAIPEVAGIGAELVDIGSGHYVARSAVDTEESGAL